MSDSVEGRWAEIFTPRSRDRDADPCLGVALLAFNAFLASISLPTAVQELGGVALISGRSLCSSSLPLSAARARHFSSSALARAPPCWSRPASSCSAP